MADKNGKSFEALALFGIYGPGFDFISRFNVASARFRTNGFRCKAHRYATTSSTLTHDTPSRRIKTMPEPEPAERFSFSLIRKSHGLRLKSALDSMFVAFSFGKPVSTFPENALSASSSSRPSRFLIGIDSRGRWVAQDERGLCGGFFVNRAEAVRFAMRETGRRSQAVILVSGVLELDLTRTGNPADRQAQRSRERRAA